MNDKPSLSRRSFLAVGTGGVLCSLLAGCSNSNTSMGSSGSAASSEAPVLQIFAANSLEKAMPEVQKLYTTKTGVQFSDTQFKASGDLVEQMRAGAPLDVLITASSGTMDDAADAKLIDATSRQDLFTNDLVVVKAASSSVSLASLADVAHVDGRVAIGDPKTVPAGTYANQSLYSVGLYSNASGEDGVYADGFASKVATADKVGTAAKYVSTGDCTIGFVYSSDIYRYDGIEQAFITPASSHDPIVYPGAVAAHAQHAQEAAQFLDFCLNDDEAFKVWSRYGFELAG